ncbi:NAD(P)-dependent oxidoreductase [Mesorhizobium sp. ES1-4]|uniref:NAD(P)-dependent oxidoreductase n=1 Tax=Mesorhizobium sp. ES1-4 TaxID=2876627 RepID=UPI001CCA115B|nr:NAD(P)-dependent oxidoreductase [Mesorhizobium sp. ES1-4]MBZ9799373.1 NAD(P)-dependent oxidoreductase [Mesorhizobium sp. ES1-4]
MSDLAHIAFLGTGLMGQPMSRRLVAAGYPMTVWNRTRAKAEVIDGARVAATPEAAARDADIVVTVLENGSVVGQVLFGEGGAAYGLQDGALVVDMSSISPNEAKDHAARLALVGVAYVDAPVSGGTVGADTATLSIMAGGTATAFERAQPVLEAMGKPVHVGPIGSGQVAKLANQMVVGIAIGAVAEALTFASRLGADPARVREALRGGFAESRVLDLHGQRMIDRDFVTRGRTVTHLKDLDNALATAKTVGSSAPLLTCVAQLFRSLTEHEGDPDHSALILEIERLNSGR